MRKNRNNIYKSILKKASWNAIATALYRGVVILAMLITARIIGKTDFGILGIIQSSITLFESVTMLGMSVTATKYIAQYRVNSPEKINRIISLTNLTAIITGLLFTFILYTTSDLLAKNILNNASLTPYLKTASFIIGFNALSNIQGGILAGFQAFKAMALANLINGFIFFSAILYGATTLGLYGVLYGLLFGSVFSAIVNTIFALIRTKKEGIALKFKITIEEWKILVKFSIPAMLAGILFAPVNWLGASILVNQPNGYASMGIFNAANQWFSALLFLPGVVSNTMLPMFSEHGHNKDTKALRQLLWKSIKILLLVTLPMAFLISMISPLIMNAYGPGFEEGAVVLISITVAASLASIQNLLSYALAAIDKIWIHTASNLIWAIFYICGVIILTRMQLGALSLSGAMVLAYAFKLIVSVTYTIKYTSRNEVKILKQ
jgi:O-antigen/teichoic acid export membrane protein